MNIRFPRFLRNKARNKLDQKLSRIGLILHQRCEASNRPSFGELEAFRSGQMDEPRYSEIQSAIARDPDCYADFARLLQLSRDEAVAQAAESADNPAKVNQRQRSVSTKTSYWVGAGTAAVLASITGIVLLFPVMMEPELAGRLDQAYQTWGGTVTVSDTVWPWRPGLQSKTSLSSDDTLQVYFQAGLRAGLERMYGADDLRPIIDELPTLSNDCPDSRCRDRVLLGQWTALVQAICLNPQQTDNEFWQQQRDWAADFLKNLDDSNDPAIRPYHSRVQDILAASSTRRCARVLQLTALAKP